MPIRIVPNTKAGDRHPRREWNSPERRKERQQQYMDKHGEPGPRRKRLTPADTTRRDRDKKIENLHERMGGGEKAKPHSSREGRVASGKNRLDRYRKKAQDIMKPITVKRKRKHSGVRILKAKGGKAGTGPRPGTRIKARKAREAEWWTGRQGMHAVYNPTIDKKLREKRPHSSPEGRMRDVKTAYAKAAAEHKKKMGRPAVARRAKHAVGGAVKTIPKITKRFLDFIKTGKHVDKHGVKTNIPKAAERLTGKPHVDHGKRKRTKHLGKGKAAGGRIGFQHGGRTNLLEELGRVEGERSNRNRRAEVSRIHGELNRGYKSGGAVLKGKKVGIQIK